MPGSGKSDCFSSQQVGSIIGRRRRKCHMETYSPHHLPAWLGLGMGKHHHPGVCPGPRGRVPQAKVSMPVGHLHSTEETQPYRLVWGVHERSRACPSFGEFIIDIALTSQGQAGSPLLE